MILPEDMQLIIRTFRDEMEGVIKKAIDICQGFTKQQILPERQNTRTNFLWMQSMTQLLIEKNIITQEELDAKFKTNEDAFKVAMADAEEKAKQKKILTDFKMTLTKH